MVPGQEKIHLLQDNIEKVIKGKREVIRLVLTALLARGNILIEDVPGVGKSTLAHTLARSLDLSFRRIQFTSDLLPSDILGVMIYNQQTQAFEFKPGPIFAHIILADEINRTTPKTQSSLLEAMNDNQISVDSRTYPLPNPFMVMATQNPMEFHGTYPLPESQLDRFMLKIRIGYPDPPDEKVILTTQRLVHRQDEIQPVVSGAEILGLQEAADEVHLEESLVDYILLLARETRTHERFILGVSPRGAMALQAAAKAYALVNGRTYCVPDDIKRLAPLVFSHRVMIHPRLDNPGRSGEEAERVLEELVGRVPVPL